MWIEQHAPNGNRQRIDPLDEAQEQIRLLDEIGFRWQANKSPAKSADDLEAVASTGAAAAAAASPYQANEMTTDQAQNLLALSEYPEFEGNI